MVIFYLFRDRAEERKISEDLSGAIRAGQDIDWWEPMSSEVF